MHDELLLVGSLPLDSAEDVFKTFGTPLGKHLNAIPDGEIGPRRNWVSRVHYQVFAAHQQLEHVRHPRPDKGIERQFPHDDSDGWQFRVRSGIDNVTFGDPGWRLGYARDALNSYFVFRTLKEKGVLPAHLRFQVSIPMVNSVVASRTFPNPADLNKVRPSYEAALRDEVLNICTLIPHDELAIQWDLAREISDIHGIIAGSPIEGSIERNLGQVPGLSASIPAKVQLGYHFCFGTLGGWPRFSPANLSRTVLFANAVVEASGRRVDWLHLPLLDKCDDAFVAPLADLKPRGARVYLGVVHNMAGYQARVAMARKYLPEFGVGAYCGLGRTPPEGVLDILREHREAVGE